MAEKALTELCSICYANTPKYKCPRCHLQTCSLPCYKRHQQRATCNGQRNPAAYVKRSEWQTPSGIDHDYNYLKSVERSLVRADQASKERGTSDAPADAPFEGKHDRNVARAWRGGSALQRYLAQNRIEVVKAPKGMSRQLTNSTRVTNGNRVVWTLDWMDEGGAVIEKDDEAAAESTISALWDASLARKRNAEKKRQRAEGRLENESTGRAAKRRLSSHKQGANRHDNTPAELHMSQVAADNEPKSIGRSSESELTKNSASITDDTAFASPTGKETVSRDQDQKKHFYLLRTGTASKMRVLIPLDSSVKLTTCLTGRRVLEYPAIYVLEQPPSALPENYTLESEYLKSRSAEDQELNDMIKTTKAQGQDLQDNEALETTTRPQLDSDAILAMLKRDVNV